MVSEEASETAIVEATQSEGEASESGNNQEYPQGEFYGAKKIIEIKTKPPEQPIRRQKDTAEQQKPESQE